MNTNGSQVEEALRRSEAKFRRIFENSPLGMAIVSTVDQSIRQANEQICALLGYTEAELTGLTVIDITHPEDMAVEMNDISRVMGGETSTYTREKRYIRKDGQVCWVKVTATVLPGLPEEEVLALGIVEDITRRKQAEIALQESELKFRSLVDQAADMLYFHDLEGNILDVNQAAITHSGYTRHELLNMKAYDIDPDYIEREDAGRFWDRIRDRVPFTFEARHQRKDGSIFPVEITLGKVRLHDGLYILALARDITARKQAEADLRKALAEKEALLREVHHRVKNNLQIINSLIGLQASRITDPATQQLFQEFRGRIMAMALVHEDLYQSPNLAQVDCMSYLKHLVTHLVHSLAYVPVRVRVEAEEIFLGVDIAIPCGLIVTELVTNALKYAFPDRIGDPGNEIRVIVARKDGLITLLVSDNGVGLPSDLDQESSSTLSLELVDRWVTRQLGGTLEVETGQGTTFKIIFPEDSLSYTAFNLKA